MSRRDLLKRGAVIGGALWVVPAVQVLNMASASAGGTGDKDKGDKGKSEGAPYGNAYGHDNGGGPKPSEPTPPLSPIPSQPNASSQPNGQGPGRQEY